MHLRLMRQDSVRVINMILPFASVSGVVDSRSSTVENPARVNAESVAAGNVDRLISGLLDMLEVIPVRILKSHKSENNLAIAFRATNVEWYADNCY